VEIKAEEGLELVAALWADEYPLVRKYFGHNLAKLLRADQRGDYQMRFARKALRPQLLEARLQRIEDLGQTRRVVAEVGAIDDPDQLDDRLSDAWAELRVMDQLHREGFTSIWKVQQVVDLIADRDEVTTAFQVTRINKSWREQVSKHGQPGTSPGHIPYGAIGDIYKRLSNQLYIQLSGPDEQAESDEYGPLSYFFWDALLRKNSDLKHWSEEGHTRCLVIVSSERDLQDPMVRHIACRLIREALHEWLQELHFEELLWLPDAGNGAWFKIGATTHQTRCLADWNDGPESSQVKVSRSELNLDSVWPE
jgi:hypothetical protein